MHILLAPSNPRPGMGLAMVAARAVGRCLATLVLAVALGICVPWTAQLGHAQQVPTTTQGAAEGLRQGAPTAQPATLRYFNRAIFTFRTDLYGRTPALRAESAVQNVDRVAAKGGPATVSFRELKEGTLVLLDGEAVFGFTANDLDPLGGETMTQARAGIAAALGEAVTEANTANSPRRLMKGILWSLLATFIAIVAVALVLRLGRRTNRYLSDLLTRRLAILHHEAAKQLATNVRAIVGWLARIAFVILLLIVLEEWLRFVLDHFAYTRPWADAMRGWIARRLGELGRVIAEAIPGLVTAVLILLFARLLTQAVTITFRGVQSGRFKIFSVDTDLAEPTRKICVVVIWLFAIAIAYPFLPGSQTEAFRGLSVLVGLMISLGASSAVAQAAGSFTILYSRTMRAGDLIKSGDTEGTVLHIGLFATRVRTLAGVEVSIPNTVVLSNQLHNYSRHPDGEGMWLESGVTIGYDAPWRQIHKLLLDAAGKTRGVVADPEPFVLQTALSDFYVDYRLRVRIVDVAARRQILSDLHANIQDEFNTAGVQIMSPHYEADPAGAKVVPPARWNG